MDFNLLECVVLSRDLPDHGLRASDVPTLPVKCMSL
jgi:hypothetical protein